MKFLLKNLSNEQTQQNRSIIWPHLPQNQGEDNLEIVQ